MPTNQVLDTLNVNILKEAQFDAAVRSGVITDTDISIITDYPLEKIQVESLPTASAEEEGNIYQYVGATDSSYTNGYFYKCISGGSVDAIEVSTMPAPSAEEEGKLYKYVGETSSEYTNSCYYKCQGTLIADDWSSDSYYVYSWVEAIVGDAGVSQVSTMPTASAEELGNIYQYTGETSSEYTNGSYYKCTSYEYAGGWGEENTTVYSWKELEHIESNDAYSWVQLNVQPQPQLAAVATSGSYNDLINTPTIGAGVLTIQKNGTAVDTFSANASENKVINITVPVNAADVNALADSTKYAANVSLTIDSSTFVVTLQLKDQDGSNLGTAQTIDLPLESVVVSGSYDNTNKKIILTLKDGSTIDVPVADLVAGLQSEITSTNKLDADLVDDTNSVHKFVTAAEKAAWNDKAEVVFREWNEGE